MSAVRGFERAPDLRTVERARADGSVIVTFDLDFGDILALGVFDKPSEIIFRLADERANREPAIGGGAQ